jgi:hypothetical protein
VRRYLADTTTLIVYAMVVGSFSELVIAGLTVDQWLRARLASIPVVLITGRPYGLYRDWLWRLAGADNGDRVRRLIVDTTAFVTFQLPAYWTVLAVAGASLSQIAAASVSVTLILALTGRPYGALLDLFRRLYGLTPRVQEHALD